MNKYDELAIITFTAALVSPTFLSVKTADDTDARIAERALDYAEALLALAQFRVNK